MSGIVVLALAPLVVVFAVYLAGWYAPEAISWIALAIVTVPPLVVEAIAAYQLYMAIHTQSMEFAFADMGFAIVTIFNLAWLPSMGCGHWLGRRQRSRFVYQ